MSLFDRLGLDVLVDETPSMLTDLTLFDQGEPGPDPDASMLSRTRFTENGPVSEFSVDLGSLPGFNSSGFLAILDLAPIDYIFEGIVGRSVTVVDPNLCTTFVGLGCAPELSTRLEVRNVITLAYDFTPRTAVPEPATGALLLGALVGLGGMSWRRRLTGVVKLKNS